MWIFCCGAPRSGSTLQYNIAATLVERSHLGKRIGYINPIDFDKIQKLHKNVDSYLVLKCHELSESMISEVKTNNAFVLYTYRDVRDVVVSMIKKFGRDFQYYLDDGFIENYLKFDDSIKGMTSAYISKYEETIENLRQEIKNVSIFLKIEISNLELKQMVDEFSLTKLKEFSNNKQNFSDASAILDNNKNMYHQKTLLHKGHIISGESGQYVKGLKNWELKRIETKTGAWLQNNGYFLK